ncbi:hypothetical protein [Streptomyces globisporus]|uniref:hypothetical protein n=1 Tax=Streptomyces globisporus TaxID=1908 RepID=UPI00368B35BD
MSARPARTASTDSAARSKATSSTGTPSRRPNSRARSTETPAGSALAGSRWARIGLPRLIEARRVPPGANVETRASGVGC